MFPMSRLSASPRFEAPRIGGQLVTRRCDLLDPADTCAAALSMLLIGWDFFGRSSRLLLLAGAQGGEFRRGLLLLFRGEHDILTRRRHVVDRRIGGGRIRSLGGAGRKPA